MNQKIGMRPALVLACATALYLPIALFISSGARAQNAAPSPAADAPKLFQDHCASCHTPFNPMRAPWPQTLRLMTAQNILQALETGKMQAQGSTMTHAERFTLAHYLGRHEVATATKSNPCPADVVTREPAARWNGWGVDPENSRLQPEAMAQLTKADVAKLKVKWAFGMAGATGAGGPPTIIGDRFYVGGGDGAVHALNSRTGCEYWSLIPSAAVRTAISVSGDGTLAYFGDVQARAYAVDAATGKVVWKTELDQHPFAMITGAPKLYDGKLYVPVSSAEELGAANPKYECCTFRGSVAALDAKTGAIVWQTYTIPGKAAPLPAAAGKEKFGPSGAAVWSTPTVDAAKGVLYFGTGDNYSDTDTDTSDAIFAVSLADGKILWTAQLTKHDTYNIGCGMLGKGNCPKDAGPDFDIGAPPILQTLSGKKRILIVGQKSGVVMASIPMTMAAKSGRRASGRAAALAAWNSAAQQTATTFTCRCPTGCPIQNQAVEFSHWTLRQASRFGTRRPPTRHARARPDAVQPSPDPRL